ncbi:MAG: hypothetical protein AAF939_16400 [Planctomycetota bacterium]
MTKPNRKYLLRFEGVNLGEIIDDTDQISARRGGGLMMLDAAGSLPSMLDPAVGKRLNEIQTGASIGLFEFESDSVEEAHSIRAAVEKVLETGALSYRDFSGKEARLPLKHGTFVVDIVKIDPEESDYNAVQRVIAKNRFRQLQQPTLSLDGIWDRGKNEPCFYNGIRVGQSKVDLPGESDQQALSHSVRDRREYGRGARQRFYRRELGREDDFDLKFTNDLQTLADAKSFGKSLDQSSGQVDDGFNRNGRRTIPQSLNQKLAIFYVDGNGFGDLGAQILGSENGLEGYRQWSTGLKVHHRQLLDGLLEMVQTDPFWRTAKDEIRLETLLWGGDEILWVVPAWKGWQLAKWFFSQEHQINDRQVAYACGVVFCNAKAPIKNGIRLARELGDLAKQATQSHGLAYEVLESFDDVTVQLAEHRKRFVPSGEESVDQLVIQPQRLVKFWDRLIQLSQESQFPIRQLYRFVNAWIHSKTSEMSESRSRLIDGCRDCGVNIDSYLSEWGEEVGWLHLLQIMPYLKGVLENQVQKIEVTS